MRQPKQQIDRNAVQVWRITGLLFLVLFLVAGVIGWFILEKYHWYEWRQLGTIPFFVLFLIGSVMIFVIPVLRWKFTRYEITREQVYIQSGFFFRHRTVIPMTRIQHVKTKQGPISRPYQLAELMIYTAGGSFFKIPALRLHEAEQLRDRIAEWVRADDDV